MKDKPPLIIIGAGLSGLYAAYLLQNNFNIIILEARERLGGRIFTHKGHDLGPSWIWPHQKHILSLLQELNLETFSQYIQGDALYDAPEGLQKFKAPSSAPSYRLKGGLGQLIQALEKKVPQEIIHLGQEVLSITQEKEELILKTRNKSYRASYVLSTLAPRLAAEKIHYSPALNEDTKAQMQNIPTWMGHAAKCVIEYPQAFWKDQSLSGFVYSPQGPLGEIHDACTQDQAALFGFVHSNATRENLLDAIKAQMMRIFPQQSIQNIYLLDWQEERFSASSEDKKGLSVHPSYGHSLHHFQGKLIFMGTESAYEEGGYLEGAIHSAKKVAQELSE